MFRGERRAEPAVLQDPHLQKKRVGVLSVAGTLTLGSLNHPEESHTIRSHLAGIQPSVGDGVGHHSPVPDSERGSLQLSLALSF